MRWISDSSDASSFVFVEDKDDLSLTAADEAFLLQLNIYNDKGELTKCLPGEPPSVKLGCPPLKCRCPYHLFGRILPLSQNPIEAGVGSNWADFSWQTGRLDSQG